MICRNHPTQISAYDLRRRAKRFGRQNQTSAALRCYAASLKSGAGPIINW